ncbi:probable E3 ubiquitin-protein ligase sinah [Diabrotica virgifera virgifera]|uniref:RING-type E3 ubiquitin transferase n=1 Tax=Diabrotica virgifera virgifera TaxID=50390 RepID=A0ABM5KLU0_DIAVI|nr:probable E3 ubiquitin-protein ligase sinah [Diabrotica virgifera virgifera]
MASNETLEAFEKSLISKFECPVCFKFMQPPIRLCISGHIFCTHCFENIESCALCRAEKSPYRCIVLEQIHASLSFPCKYVDEGCIFSGKSDTLITHQEYCELSTTECPLRYNNCTWTGFRSGMIEHCRTDHSENIFFENEQKLKVANFNILADVERSILLSIHNNLFRCYWDLEAVSGSMRFAVYSLGKPSLEKTIYFKVGMFIKNTNEEAVSMIGPCYLLKNENTKFIGKKYLSTNFDMIKDLCDTNGDFNYSIGIIERSVPPQDIEPESNS